MSTIRINLYDYQRIVREVEVQKMLASIFAAVLAGAAICFLWWMVEVIAVKNLEGDIEEEKSKVSALKTDYDHVQDLKKKKDQFGEVINSIDSLRTKRSKTTELLEDLGRSLPEGVWMKTIAQKTLTDLGGLPELFLGVDPDAEKEAQQKADNEGVEYDEHQFIELKGQGHSNQAIIHFVNRLRTLPYFDNVMLTQTNQKWTSNQPVQEFTIYCHVLKVEAPAKG